MTKEEAEKLKAGNKITDMRTGSIYTVIGQATGAGVIISGIDMVIYQKDKTYYVRPTSNFNNFDLFK